MNFAKLTNSQRLQIVSDLEQRKLIKVNRTGTFNGAPAWVLKYAKSVFWDARWDESPWLTEMRGTVIDSNGELLAYPFTKLFNYGERNRDLDPALNEKIKTVLKINGFMAAATRHGDSVLISTTGSVNSDFVQLAQDKLTDLLSQPHAWAENTTFLFEIVHEADPHIVAEATGAYLIGARDLNTGEMWTEEMLDRQSAIAGTVRPRHEAMRFEELLVKIDTEQVEGYMVYRDNGHSLKIKTKHYLVSKFVARGKKSETIWKNSNAARQMFDEEFYFLIDELPKHHSLDEWQLMTEQEKLETIRKIL